VSFPFIKRSTDVNTPSLSRSNLVFRRSSRVSRVVVPTLSVTPGRKPISIAQSKVSVVSCPSIL